MILEQETYEKFGYYPSELKPQSHKYILAACDDCGKIREINRESYRALCKSCSHLGAKNHFFGKHHSKSTKKRIRKARKRQKPTMLGKHHSEKTKKQISDKKRKLTFVQRKLNNSISSNMRRSLKGTKKGRHWETIVGYTLSELMQTLEKEFRDGMSWENYGKWHIDHIIPLAQFQFDTTEDPEFKKAWALNNLQPLWADENQKKSNNFLFF